MWLSCGTIPLAEDLNLPNPTLSILHHQNLTPWNFDFENTLLFTSMFMASWIMLLSCILPESLLQWASTKLMYSPKVEAVVLQRAFFGPQLKSLQLQLYLQALQSKDFESYKKIVVINIFWIIFDIIFYILKELILY